jgi:hypothetical protein
MINLESYGVFDYSESAGNEYEYTATEFTAILKALSGTGISINVGDAFECTSNGLEITVGSGLCLIKGRYGENTEDTVITLDAESASLQRIDRIVITSDVSNRLLGVEIVKGTASANPVAPTLTQTDLYWQVSCFQAHITNGSTVVLTDERTLIYTPDDVITAINGKQNTIAGAASTIVAVDLTANKVLISNASGKVAVSATTSTEIGYLSGVTSSVQTQLNSKEGTLDADQKRKITVNIADPSGGDDGDIWIKVV